MSNTQKQIPLTLILMTLSIINSIAQNNHLIDSKSNLFKKYEINESEEGWLYLKKNGNIKAFAPDLIKEKTSLGLTDKDALKSKKGSDLVAFVSEDSNLDTTGVIRIDQVHNSRRVESAQVLIHHYENGDVWLMHGRLAKNLPNSNASINEAAALSLALAAVGAEKYAWQDEEWEQQAKLDRDDPNATYYPKGEIIYARLKSNDDYDASNYRLAWEFEISTLLPEQDILQVMVDASNGKVIRNMSKQHRASGTVNTLYNGQKSFITYYRTLLFDFILKDNVNGTIHTKRPGTGTSWSSYKDVDDKDNVWSEAAATSHWAVQQAYKYFKTTFARNGLNNSNVEIRVMAETALPSTNYTYNSGNYIKVGRALLSNGTYAGVGTSTSLDVIGHEYTHGVDHYLANLPTLGETGALGESFSDIFGVMVQKYALGTAINWTIGEQEGDIIRSLSNPHSESNADTYNDPIYWINPTSSLDNGGIHFNCGVQNYWFYLLSVGKSGTNSLGQAYSVTGIGETNAAKIAYRNFSVYMRNNSNFAAARAGAINAARDLFGECSQQYISTINAWHAVGVGSRMDFCVSPTITPSYSPFCIETGNFNATLSLVVYPANATVTWNANYPLWYYSTYGPSFYLDDILDPEPGLYTVTATVTSGGNSATRSAAIELVYCQGQQARIASNYHGDKGTSGESNLPALNVIPNPAATHFNIVMVLPKKEESTVTLLDMTGRVVMRLTVNDLATIEVSYIPNGLYLLMVKNSFGLFTEKVIVNK